MAVVKSAETKWTLNLFGKPKVTGNGQTLDQFGTKRAVQLLARLALSHRKAFTRGEAADLLWPDDFYDATRLRLRQELTRLRRGLGPARDVLQTDEEWVRLEAKGFEVDVQTFERLFESIRSDPAASESICKEALKLSEQPFLEGHDESWIQAERSRLEQIRYWILVELAGLQANKGDHAAALETAKQAVLADPLQEAGHLKVMEELGKLGRLSDALGQYQHLKRILRDQLDEAPSAKAESLADTLQRPVLSAPQPKSVASGLRFAVPAAAEPIYGREPELMHLMRALEPGARYRIVTLIGPGGIGKTRLAQQAASAVEELFEGRVAWIGLADLSDAANIPLALAAQLGITLGPNVNPMERVTSLMPREPALLVLDNIEQLLPEAIGTVRALIESRQALQLLITSREALKLGGELTISVDPLPLPKEGDSIEQPSLRIFLDSQMSEPGFREPEPAELEVLREIAERLEGIPLSLQLASGRLRTVSPRDLLSQLDKRLDMVNRRVDAPERHRTIRAALSGSFHALRPDLQRLMGRLSVFRGGWNQSAAAFVCEIDDPLPAMEELLDRSLVRVDREDIGLRFRMLEVVRDYVRETIAPDDLSRAHARHADWVIELGQPELWRKMDAAALERFKTIDPERDNVREAARFCLSADLQRAVLLGATYSRYWTTRSLIREALAFYRELFGHLDELPVTPDLARASYGHAQTLYVAQGFSPADEGYSVSERTAGFCVKTGLELEAALCKVHQARTPFIAGDYDASLAYIESAKESYRRLGSDEELAIAIQNEAMVFFYQGRARDALAAMEEASTLIEEGAVPFHDVQTNMMSSFMYLETGELDKAKIRAHKALSLAESYGFAHFTPMIQEVCGKVAQAEGDLALAAKWFEVSAAGWDFLGNAYQFADQLHLQARVNLLKHEPELALPLLESAARLWQSRALMNVVPCVLTSAARAYIQLGDAIKAARLFGAVRTLPNPSRDSEMATEIEYMAAIERDLVAALGAERLAEILKDSPDLDAALLEAFSEC